MRRVTSSILAAMLLVAATAGAADRPISGSKLQLKRSGTKESLTFISKDRSFLFPTSGGPDDPQAVGAVLEIVPFPGTAISLAMPPGTGKPGWTAKAGASSRLKFDNPLAPGGISPVRVALLRQGRQIKITARAIAGLSFAPATESIAIRLTTGSLRACVRFDVSTVRRRDTSVFLAVNAASDSLPDCSDESIGLPSGCELSGFPACGGSCYGDDVCIGGLGTCSCVPPSSLCGASTAPACGGVCPGGQVCNDVGNGCACLPDGATPCGTPGAPTCGGACPSGEVCRPMLHAPVGGTALGCGCGAPTACSQSGGIECPNGRACSAGPPFGVGCYLMSIGGVPCDEVCPDGGPSYPVYIAVSGGTFCVCATPAPCCEGGFACPPSQYCELPTLNTCAFCQPL